MTTLADVLQNKNSTATPMTLADKLRLGNTGPQVTSDSIITSLSKKYGSISDTLGNFSTGVAKGAVSTIKGLGEIGTKVGDVLSSGVELVGGPKNVLRGADVYRPETPSGQRANEILSPEGTAQSIGKGVEQIAEFFIPAGKISSVEKILAGKVGLQTIQKLTPIVGAKAANLISRAASLGTKMIVRGAEGGGVIAAQTGGDVKDTATGAGVSAAFPALGALSPLAKGSAEFLGGVGKRLAGSLAGGRGTAVIDEIVKDPRAALEGLTGKSLDVLSKDARLLKESAVNIKIKAGKEYNRVLNNLQSIFENEGKSFDKGTEINKITDTLRDKFGITKAGNVAELTGEEVADKGALDFNVTRFQKPNEQNTIKNALKFVKSFREPLSPKTMEGIASTIDKMKGSDSELNSVLHSITSSLRDSVAKMGEETGYKEGADIARNFATAMDKLEDFTNKFKATPEDLRPRGAGTEVVKIGDTRQGIPVILPETEKTKIIQDISTLFSGNKDADKETIRKMVFGGQEILSREAGRTLATATEKASGKLGDFIRETVIAPLLSPTAVGKIAARTSLAVPKVTKFLEKLRSLEPGLQGAVIKLITSYNQ